MKKPITLITMVIGVSFSMGSSTAFSESWFDKATKALKDVQMPSVGEESTTPKSPLEELATDDILISTGTGAVVGGVLGYIKGGEKGAYIGAALGALGGFAVGNIAAERRKDYATESDFLDAEIASANTAVSTKEAQLAQLDAQIVSNKREITGLEQRFYRNENILEEAQDKYEEISAQIDENEETQIKYQNSIEYLDSIVNKQNTESAAQKSEIAKLESQRASLIQKRSELTNQYAKLNGLNEKLKVEQNRLSALIAKAKTKHG